MKWPACLLNVFALVLTLAALTAPAHAQATRTWVSGVGDDANPCSRTAPCKTFAGAISKTAAGGEINCIDPGGFGAVTISKAVTIDCANVEAGVLVAGTNGVVVNAGASDVVVLRGIDFIGTLSTPALNGIRFTAGGALHVEKCLIREFTSPAPNGAGILFQPSASSKLFVSQTVLSNNSGGAVVVRPTGTGNATVVIATTTAFGNASGFTADTTAPTTGPITMLVRDSYASGNATHGYLTQSVAASGSVGMLIERSSATQNGSGISANGPKSAYVVGGSVIWGNGVGLVVANGGDISSFGNNELADSGTFSGPPLGLK